MKSTFEEAVETGMLGVRKELRNIEDLTRFSLEIKMTGRVHQGDVKIEYTIAEGDYGSGAVRGVGIEPVLEEFLRRHGWEKKFAALSLTYEKSQADSEIAGNDEGPMA